MSQHHHTQRSLLRSLRHDYSFAPDGDRVTAIVFVFSNVHSYLRNHGVKDMENIFACAGGISASFVALSGKRVRRCDESASLTLRTIDNRIDLFGWFGVWLLCSAANHSKWPSSQWTSSIHMPAYSKKRTCDNCDKRNKRKTEFVLYKVMKGAAVSVLSVRISEAHSGDPCAQVGEHVLHRNEQKNSVHAGSSLLCVVCKMG